VYFEILAKELKRKSMLVLSRNMNESIIIDDDIEIVIVRVQGNKVRLGIKAPRDVAVNRKEIYLRIQEEKKSPEKTSAETDNP
jgi:carbon storage regulator